MTGTGGDAKVACSTQAGARSPRPAARVGVAACAWALLFATAHSYWALGGTALITAEQVADGREQWDRDPWGYAIGWAILCLLFACAGLFPLALAWPTSPRGRRGLRLLAVTSGYATLIALAAHGLAVGDRALVAFSGLVCGGGAVVALALPRGHSPLRRMVLVATWALGLAMLAYGAAYAGFAALNGGALDRAHLVTYLVTGGLAWSAGGALFVATAWLARHGNGVDSVRWDRS